MTKATQAAGTILALACGLALAAQPARALSFSVPAGRTITDIDLSSGSTGLDYDGDASPETLSMTADVNVIRLDDGSEISLSSGQLTFSLNLMLVTGSVEVTTVGFTTFVDADFVNGLTYDFVILDNVAAQQVLGGDFLGDAVLALTEGFAGLSGTFGGGSGGGTFSLTQVNPALSGKISTSGNLAAQLTTFNPGSLASILDGGSPQGFNDFTAQPGIDFNFAAVPEPGAAGLLGLGGLLAGVIFRRR